MKNREAGLVSIIVPVYRAAAYIADTIGMVFSQTYGRWELLLVDDCSGDGSVEAIEKHCRHTRITRRRLPPKR